MFYLIKEMSFKRVLDVVWTVLPRNLFRNPIKSDYMLLSCHVRVSERIYTLQSCSKQAPYLKFK